MRFNDYRYVPLLGEMVFSFAANRHLSSPLNWEHFARLAKEAGAGFLAKPHEAHISQYHGKELLEPFALNGKGVVNVLRQKAVDLGIPQPQIVDTVIQNYCFAWFRGKPWLSAGEMLLELPDAFKNGVAACRDKARARLLLAGQAMLGQSPVLPSGLARVTEQELDLRYVDYLCGEEGDSFSSPPDYDDGVSWYGRGFAEWGQVQQKASESQSAKMFISLMHALLGPQWRPKLLEIIEQNQEQFPGMFSARVSF